MTDRIKVFYSNQDPKPIKNLELPLAQLRTKAPSTPPVAVTLDNQDTNIYHVLCSIASTGLNTGNMEINGTFPWLKDTETEDKEPSGTIFEFCSEEFKVCVLFCFVLF